MPDHRATSDWLRTVIAVVFFLAVLLMLVLSSLQVPDPPPAAPMRMPIASISPTDPAGR